jgi:hypothetical protein
MMGRGAMGKANLKDRPAWCRRGVWWIAATTIVGVLIAQALVSAGGALAATDYPTGRPLALVAHAPGDEELYWRGSDGYLWEDAESGGEWHGPERTTVAGLASNPTAAIGSHGYDYVFWEGSDRSLWEAGDYPQGWVVSDLGMGPLGSQPTAASLPTSSGVSEIDVFWDGTDGDLWRALYQTATGRWTGPSDLGMGTLGSPPSATEQSTSAGTQIQVYWEGTNGALWEADTSGGSKWSGPTSLGMGPLGSAPAVASLSYGNEAVFWGGTYGRLWQASWNGTSWNGAELNGPTSVGFGPMATAPTVAGVETDEYDVFWIGTDADMWEAQLVGQTWTSDQSLGPMVPLPSTQTTPVTVTIPSPPATGSGRRIRVEILMKWRWHGTHTRLRKVRWVGRFPARATVRVACHGRRCPRRLGKVGHRHLRALMRLLEARVFHPGQRLTITVSAPGWIAERAQVTIRNGALPLAKLL